MSQPPLIRVAPLALAALASAQSSWEPAPSLPFPRSKNFAVTFDGAVHSIGGSPWRNGGDQDGSVFRLGPKGWSEVATLEGMGPIVDQVGGVDDLGRIIVFGGHDSVNGDIGSARAYLPSSGTTEDLPSPVNYPFDYVGCAVDGEHRVYSIGGGYGPNGLNYGQFGRWIGSENRWENLAYLPYTRASVAAAYDGNGGIWILGGYTSFGGWRIVDVNRYAVAANTWTTHGTAFLPVATADAQAVLGADGRIYMMGGTIGTIPGTTRTATTWILDTANATLEQGPPLALARSDFGATLASDRYIYVVGGITASGASTTSVERLYTGHCASIDGQSGDATVAPGDTLSLSATVSGDDLEGFQWQRDGVDLVDGPNGHGGTVSGATSPSLEITVVTTADAGEYVLIATNPCGGAASAPIAVTVSGGLPGDLNGDGHVNAGDLAAMLAAWSTASTTADLDHDGQVGAPDLGMLLAAWTG